MERFNDSSREVIEVFRTESIAKKNARSYQQVDECLVCIGRYTSYSCFAKSSRFKSK